MCFTQGLRIKKQNPGFEARIRGVISVSGEKLHAF